MHDVTMFSLGISQYELKLRQLHDTGKLDVSPQLAI